MTLIGASDLDVLPLSLGGNVFGWTADQDESHAILDAFIAGGGDFIDTADSYSAWVPGNAGGESERLIGGWLAARPGVRDRVVIATKVGHGPGYPQGLSAVRQAAEASLQRLGTDRIDLYYAHYDDESLSPEELASAFGAVVADGLVRHVAASNFRPERIRAWVLAARELGVAGPVAIQPHYNLVHRAEVEAQVIPLAEEFGLSLIPYYALAAGFLTGKYRSADVAAGASPRAAGATKLVTESSLAVIDALERIGQAHDASIAATALAWLRAQPTVAAPIASASRVGQVADLLASTRLDLSAAELAELTEVSDRTLSTKE